MNLLDASDSSSARAPKVEQHSLEKDCSHLQHLNFPVVNFPLYTHLKQEIATRCIEEYNNYPVCIYKNTI